MKKQIDILYLLRGIAALMICFYHFTHFSYNNRILFEDNSFIKIIADFCLNGVPIFFVISGFIIPFSMWNSGYELENIHKFLLKRFIRIEIPMLISVFLILLFHFVMYQFSSWPFEFTFKQFFLNVTYLVPFSSENWINPIYWTLAIEFQFYIFMALFFVILNYKNKTVSLLFILLFACSCFLSAKNDNLFYHAPLFAMGLLLFLSFKSQINNVELVLTGLIVLVVMYLKTPSLSLVTVCFLTQLAIRFGSFKSKVTNVLGEISYSLYLIHGLIGGITILVLQKLPGGLQNNYIILILILSSTFVGSYIFWYLIERPSQKWSKNIRLNREVK